MIAFKFLCAGQVAPFSGVSWTTGAWVRSTPGRSGVAACRVADLPFWIGDELWEVELAGAIVPGARKLAAERGRLVAPVPGWDAACARALIEACAGQVRGLPGAAGYLEDLAELAADAQDDGAAPRSAATAAYVAAQAAARLAGDGEGARAGQAGWLAARLGLSPS